MSRGETRSALGVRKTSLEPCRGWVEGERLQSGELGGERIHMEEDRPEWGCGDGQMVTG